MTMPLRLGQGDMTGTEFIERFEMASEIWKEAIGLLGSLPDETRAAIMQRFAVRDYKAILAGDHDALEDLVAGAEQAGDSPISPDLAGQLRDFERKLDILLAEMEGIPEPGRPAEFPWVPVAIGTAAVVAVLGIAGVFSGK